MAWLAGLTSKAEELLNKVDQVAADSFKEDDPSSNTSDSNLTQETVSHPKVESSVNLGQSQSYYGGPASVNSLGRKTTAPPTVTRTGTPPAQSLARSSTPPSIPKSASMSILKKDKDDELFKFLNSSDSVESTNTKSRMKAPSGRHSRTSSIGSTTSTRSTKSSPPVINTNIGETRVPDQVDGSSSGMTDDTASKGDVSSGYHSHMDDGNQSKHSGLELENNLLKNEISSLNNEMTSVIHRAKSAELEVDRVKRQIDLYNINMSESDKMIRELQARENDLNESLKAKDSQLAVLRVRFEEADKQAKSKSEFVDKMQMEKNRILQDHTNVSGVQSQAMESLKTKLREMETSLKREQDSYKVVQGEAMTRQSKLEEEQRSLAETLTSAQKKANEDRAKAKDLANQIKSAKNTAETAKQELQEYKDKAARILQSKDRLISTLKDGTSGLGTDSPTVSIELEETKQERDQLREELQHTRMTIENLRADIQDLEMQIQTENDSFQDQVRTLDDQLQDEQRLKRDCEQEITKQKQELQYTHEELYKQKNNFQTRLQDREAEIEKLRNQVMMKSVSSTTESELEGRVRVLTESLIQKQTMLETLSTEKSSLVLQLERMEGQYKDLQSCASRMTSTTVSMHDDEDVRQRLPTFLRESPQDNSVMKNVKRATTSLDKFSIRLGVFLRRYPIARIFVIVYMIMLHFWTLVVLLTYQPEMHGRGYHTQVGLPQPPGQNNLPQGQINLPQGPV